ncbi:hypothetical protein SAMN02949497_2129 [Methylomagnum ishizawai]|uniref:VanZ like family protein n=1 Tax=Methylomagnum ishizawai TaxID=1760988 RepID=A0A1Y6D336_9GAMM|nr:VanZ family protein [Methylomagnum ishizawai]SMF94794.1 hypothetical protein SAMN02949497_2129 [Methylomagnum ishizawai]
MQTDPPPSQSSGHGAGLNYTRLWQAMAWGMVLAVAWLSLIPHPPQPPALLGWDKAQHLLAYASLMFWFRQVFAGRGRWPVFLLVLGITLECLQGLGGFRTFDPADMVANTAGVGAGLWLAGTPLGKSLRGLDHILSKILPPRFRR